MSTFCEGYGANSGGNSVKARFDDPFLLPSSEYMPTNMQEAFDFCRFLYLNNPEYRRASQRVTRHFITNYKITEVESDTEKAEIEDYLDYKLGLRHAMMEMGDDWAAFGNAFYRVHFPFKRMLTRSTKSGKRIYYDANAFPIDQMRFNLRDMQYLAIDPSTNKQEKFDFVDIRQKNKDAITLVKYDPRTIDIIHSQYTKKSRYLYRIPAPVISDVSNNNIFQINNLSKKMLTAIRDGKNFLFSNNEMFHFRAPTTSGISDSDWGIPELITNFRLLHQLQVYKKIDEQVGLDYMLPFRILSLDNQKGNGAAQKIDGVRWKQEMKKIVEARRKDKTAMFAVPVPVNYQEFGGEGKSLAPKDLIEYQTNNMLNAMGYPAELYTMSLQTSQIPSAIRLFEQSFWFIHENYNNFCRWVLSKINTYLNNQRIDISLQPPSMADNIDKQNILLQLVSQGELPRSAVFREFGIDDPVQAFRERQEEDANFAKIQKETEEKMQKEMDAEASLAAAADPGADPGGEQPGTTPMDMEQRAMQKAQEWLQIPSDGERTKAMNAAKAQDFQLYSMAKQVMEEMRSAGASDGRQAVEQQAQQQPPM